VIFGIGVDVVDINRFDRFVRDENTPLLQRLFTASELSYCAARKHRGQHYALRFAAKEAFLKALGTGLREGLSWHDIEVVNDHLGKPGLQLTGKACEKYTGLGLSSSFLSLSHDANCAIAMVVLEK
jgi:holo-[acyl-carrier protein] synthase